MFRPRPAATLAAFIEPKPGCRSQTIKAPFMARCVIILSRTGIRRCFMMAPVLAGGRTRQWAVLGLGLLFGIVPQVASAADCPGNPGALGTSRTLVVDPREHPRIRTMPYPETLPPP